MPLEKSEAVVLKAFNWSESSRTVHFFSDHFGRLPLVDRGGRSIKSKRGRVIPFARLELTFYSSRKESSGYISDCETLEIFSLEKDGTLGRLAYGSAACELLYLLLPEEEAQPALYSYLLAYLRSLSEADKRSLPALFLVFFLRTMSFLGYHPSIAFCAGCGRPGSEVHPGGGKLRFSPERGGLVCSSCQTPGEYYIGLSAGELELLSQLQRASLEEAAIVRTGYREASLLIDTLTRFLKYHSGLISDFKSLEFLDKLKRSELT